MEQFEKDYNADLTAQIKGLEKVISVLEKSALNKGVLFIPDNLVVRQAEEGEDLTKLADDPTMNTEHTPYVISGDPALLAKVQRFHSDRTADIGLYQRQIDILKGRLITE